MVAAMRAWRLLAASAVVLAIAFGALALGSPGAEAQGRPSHLAAWSDAPNRIIVHWGDPSSPESYARGFAQGEEYIVRWKRDGGTLWGSSDSKNDVPDKFGRTVSIATAGGASVGDPDLVVKLPVPDTAPGNVSYDIELYRSDAGKQNQCLSPGRVDLGRCKLVGYTSVKTNTSKTVGGGGPSTLFRGFGLASPLFDVRAAPPAQAPSGTMYGTSTQSDSTYTVNLATGEWTLRGSTGTSYPLSLAWDGDTMYGVDGDTKSTYTVDLATGAWTRRGRTGTDAPVGIEWNGSAMYGVDTVSDSTHTVDRTSGAWSAPGGTGQFLPQYMGWDGSTMYGVDGRTDSMYTVNLTSGAWTDYEDGGRTGRSRPGDMAWNGTTMYGVGISSASLNTVNLTSGAWTDAGETGVFGPSGLAWVPDASAVATLSALTLSAGTLTPTFATGTTTYTADVAATVSSITVTPTATEDVATITVDGAPTTSGSASASISLTGGDNPVSVVVTAGDGTTTQTYTVTVTRATFSTDATLSALTLSAGTLTPVFATAAATYTADVEATVTSITVTPTASEDAATITVDGAPTTSGSASASISLTEGDTTVSVVVTAEDGTATQTYTVTVTRDTPTGTPGRVPRPKITTSQRQMTVTWEEPARTGATAITGYDVQFSRGLALKWGMWPHAGTSTTTTITGLKNGNIYSVQVRAVNGEGAGAWSPLASSLVAGALGEGCQFATPSLGVIPARTPHAGPYLFCVPGASTLTAEDANSRISLWNSINSLQCTSPATLSFGVGCHQIGIKGCGTGLNYKASITLTGAGITPRTCVQSYGAVPRAIVSTGKYYDNEPDWTPLDAGLVLGQTRMTIVFDPPGDWHVWLPAAIAPWGKCSGNHKNMSSEEAEKLVRWPTSIRSGESLLIEGCASTKPVQMLAAPITGHGQDIGVGVGVAGVYLQAAPEPLIDRGWLTTRLKQSVGVILFAVPLIVVPTIWGITRKPIVAGIATIALLLITSIVLQLPVWAYLSVLLAAGAAFLLGMLLKK